MTRGAISKIVKKLSQKGLIDSHRQPGNLKETYHRLTQTGREIDERHARAHSEWERREIAFLRSVPRADKAVLAAFLRRFDGHLEHLIKEYGP